MLGPRPRVRTGPQAYDLTSGLEFRWVLRVPRAGKPRADLVGIFAGEKLIGVFSPLLDLLFSLSPYEAYGCKGYKSVDASAVVLNILMYLTTLPPPRP